MVSPKSRPVALQRVSADGSGCGMGVNSCRVSLETSWSFVFFIIYIQLDVIFGVSFFCHSPDRSINHLLT